MAVVEKNLPANAGGVRDKGLISGSGRSPGGGHGNSHGDTWQLQHFCLENPVDREGCSPQGCKESDVTEVT